MIAIILEYVKLIMWVIVIILLVKNKKYIPIDDYYLMLVSAILILSAVVVSLIMNDIHSLYIRDTGSIIIVVVYLRLIKRFSVEYDLIREFRKKQGLKYHK